MEQVKKKKASNPKKKFTDKRLPPSQKVRKQRKHPKFGTSKAELDFAKNFLDKLGVRYEWQFEAKQIGRFFDYYLPDYNILLEYDGVFFHADPRVYKEEDLNPMQKRNRRIDEIKDRWALLHGIPLIRIREKDVKENPAGVMKMLKERLHIQGDVIEKNKEMNKRHINKLNEDNQLGNSKK
jgi:very-short-patch-repair endonuclease